MIPKDVAGAEGRPRNTTAPDPEDYRFRGTFDYGPPPLLFPSPNTKITSFIHIFLEHSVC